MRSRERLRSRERVRSRFAGREGLGVCLCLGDGLNRGGRGGGGGEVREEGKGYGCWDAEGWKKLCQLNVYCCVER